VCSPACSDKQRCVRGKDGNSSCKAKKVRKLKLKIGAAIKAEAGDMTADEIKTVLGEIIQRFCDKETSDARRLCNDAATVIENMVVKITKKIADGEGEVEVDTPEEPAPSRRRLLATDDLVNTACSDPEAADEFTFTDAAAAPAAPTAAGDSTSAASSTFMMTMATFLPVLAVFN
jgi:hypothetical protein